ncbi:MAG: hypothetical protein M1831_000653 [Alyxoria varia]|nr:MAG: hypothetical protein M1831_000653 [Alyxoria varia]
MKRWAPCLLGFVNFIIAQKGYSAEEMSPINGELRPNAQNVLVKRAGTDSNSLDGDEEAPKAGPNVNPSDDDYREVDRILASISEPFLDEDNKSTEQEPSDLATYVDEQLKDLLPGIVDDEQTMVGKEDEEVARHRDRSPISPRPQAIDWHSLRLDSVWMDRSIGLIPLAIYPNQQEVDDLLNQMHEKFFSRFRWTPRVPIPSDTMTFYFGGKTRRLYTCRLVWLNPQERLYPQVRDSEDTSGVYASIPVGFPITPAEYPVAHITYSKWSRGLVRYDGIPTSTTWTKWTEANPRMLERLPTLSRYLQMRMMATLPPVKQQEAGRWPDGQGAMMHSMNGLFAIGYRVWITAERNGNPPMDKRNNVAKGLASKRDAKILISLRDSLYHVEGGAGLKRGRETVQKRE